MPSTFPFRGALLAALAVVTVIVGVSASRPQDAPAAAAPAKPGAEKTVPVTTKAGLRFDVPDAWKVQAPSSPMRQAQIALPKAEGDSEDAELIVFHFGAKEGGSVEANLDRWYEQFEGPDGKPPKASAKVDHREVKGLKVTTVDVAGKYVAPVKIGAPERHDKPGFRMLAAVVETPGGNFFFKLVGPAKTVDASAKAFSAVVDSVAFEAPKR